MSCDMRFPTMWYVRLAKPQSLWLSFEYSMSVKLQTEHHLKFLSLKGGCTCSYARLSLHMSKYHIVGNHSHGSYVLLFLQNHGRIPI